MRKVLRIFLYIISGIFALLLIVVIWLNTMPGKRFVKNKIVAFLHNKLKTEVHIGELGYGLPKFVNLKDVLFRDQANDTLLYAGNLQVDINMLKLISGKVDVQQLTLEKIHSHVYRIAPDTNFNFTYILKAFAGNNKDKKQDKPKDTSKSSLSISVKKVLLNDIHARFDDGTGGTRLAVNLDHLELGMRKIDLDEMNFHVRKLEVAGLQTSFYQDTSYLPPKPDTATTPTQFKLAADDVNLKNIAFTYGNTVSKFLFSISLGNLKTKAKNFDLVKQKVVVDNFELGNTNVKMVIGKHSPVPEKAKVVVDTLPQSSWHVTASTLNLGNVNFVMDDENKPHQQYGMDYAHLNVQQLNLKSKNILYTGDSIGGNIQHLAVREKSGLDLQELRTRFIYHPQGATLNDLYLQTPNTVLQNYLAVAYPSLDSLKTQMQRMRINTNLRNSMVGLYDVLLFVPDLRKQEFFSRHRNDKLKLEAVLKGYLVDLNINNFYVAGLHNTIIHVNGKLGGLPDAQKINYALNVQRIQSSNADLTTLLPLSVRQQIQIPASFNLVGKVSGTIKDYNTNLVMTSTDGAATLKGYIHMSPGKGRERYDLYVNTKQLNVGRILRKDSLIGAITTVITAKGQSFDINTMNAMLQGDIYAATLMGYNYRNINFHGNIAQKLGELKLISADPNAVLQLIANADLRQKDPAIVAKLNIDSADLQALKLYKDPLRIRAAIDANIPKLNADYPEGDVTISKPLMTTATQRYFLDTLLISSHPSGDSQHIVVNAEALYATITGQIPLSQIGNVIQEHISRHYNISGDSTAKPKQKIPANYNLALDATITDKPLLHVVMPGLQSMDTIGIHATVDPTNLYLAADAPHVVYNNNSIDSARIRINGADSALTYTASVERVSMPSLQLWYTNASGRLQGQEITANVSIADSVRKQRFALNAALVQKPNEQELQLRDGLVLNYKTWQVSQPNKIVFSKEGFYAQNFGFSNGNESININSTAQNAGAPLNLNINNFLISNITEIVQKDTLLANGILNTKLVAENLNTNPQAKGSLQIQDLSVKNDTVGNLDVQLTDASANEVNAKITVTGRGNDIAVNGSYYPKPVNNNSFDLRVLINSLNLRSMEGLTANQIKNSKGNIKGDLTVKGTVSAPNVNGSIQTDNLTTTVTMLGTPYKMPHEKIALSSEGIEFDNFNIIDTTGNKATIDGGIRTRDFRNMDLDMHVRARKWQALNSTAKDNKLFYGRLVLSTDLNLKGTPQAPVLDGTLKIHDTTKLTVVIPQTQPGVEERKGIVEFVDMQHPEMNSMLLPKDTMPKLAMRTGAKLDVNVGIEKNAEFNVIIDQATGDFLRVRGEAALNTAVNPDGTIGLTGTYELKSGSYELNYNLIKRRFNIQNGSTITFTGDPLRAQVDITAVYTANVPPYDLVEKQVSDPAQLNYYKQRLPFDVQLKLNGPLMKPAIAFDVVLPEEKKYRVSSDVLTLVQGKLAEMRNNPSELNKQVFALLLLNRFVSDNPFESGAGGTSAEFIARQSASRFLSEQLNQYASQLINGFELNVDLESTEDYTTGEKRNQTNLNVSASKRLLNDRLTVTVGNDFGIEGQNQNTNQNSTLVPGNLAADYQLTPDGRYMVRIYRRDELQDIVEGYVVETGVSFIVTVEYNKFKNLFISKKKRKEQRERRREQEMNDNDNKTRGAGN
ncbi:MAG: translocation/assembly module TamB domain-containing protein [Bacteroidetes bacterium]|nr:translocation/assembly module TamB domain-containing protein [Bacteroidota bacterium]